MSSAAELSVLAALVLTQRLVLRGSGDLAFLSGTGEQWKGARLSWGLDPAPRGQWLYCILL